MKSLLYACLILLVMLTHTTQQSMLAGRQPAEKFGMPCCMDMVGTVASSCCGCCKTDSTNGTTPVPANLPPVSGRDLVPQIALMVASSPILPIQLSSMNEGRTPRLFVDEHAATTPHVRLPVLFCSFLT